MNKKLNLILMVLICFVLLVACSTNASSVATGQIPEDNIDVTNKNMSAFDGQQDAGIQPVVEIPRKIDAVQTYSLSGMPESFLFESANVIEGKINYHYVSEGSGEFIDIVKYENIEVAAWAELESIVKSYGLNKVLNVEDMYYLVAERSENAETLSYVLFYLQNDILFQVNIPSEYCEIDEATHNMDYSIDLSIIELYSM